MCRDPRLYTKKVDCDILVPFPEELVNAVRFADLDALLDGSEYGGAHLSSLVRCAFGRASFDVNWDAVHDEDKYKHEPLCLYDYATSRVYP